MSETILSTSNLYEPDYNKLVMGVRDNCKDGRVQAVSDLEKALSDYHDARYCVSFSSGFWALVAAIRIKGLSGKDEVLIPSLTYRRLSDVVYWAGKTPVFVDVDEHNYAISPQSVKKNISDKTSLILAVHPIVNCCDVDGLIELSEQSGVPIVFDAVESVHETFNGKRIGSNGVGEVFSLHASKLINGMEGGYVCTNEEDTFSRLKEFRDREGGKRRSEGIELALNGMHALFALQSLKEIEINVTHNFAIYKRYMSSLSECAAIRILEFDETEQTSYKNIVAEVGDEFPLTRDQLVNHLNKKNILARAYYSPALHMKSYQYDVCVKDVGTTEKLSNKLINLPCGHRTREEDVDFVCLLIKQLAI